MLPSEGDFDVPDSIVGQAEEVKDYLMILAEKGIIEIPEHKDAIQEQREQWKKDNNLHDEGE